jgi:hypothetical protein
MGLIGIRCQGREVRYGHSCGCEPDPDLGARDKDLKLLKALMLLPDGISPRQ